MIKKLTENQLELMYEQIEKTNPRRVCIRFVNLGELETLLVRDNEITQTRGEIKRTSFARFYSPEEGGTALPMVHVILFEGDTFENWIKVFEDQLPKEIDNYLEYKKYLLLHPDPIKQLKAKITEHATGDYIFENLKR